ncbi:outer membrane beta-barrel protein [Novosphingobium sp. ZN18A2]|uniref:outer membrane beta-barrel protein n=1 Tax=Novosphingobium sp. ZN18A2 TaxID=3079861 RepID=UPI0030CFA9E4
MAYFRDEMLTIGTIFALAIGNDPDKHRKIEQAIRLGDANRPNAAPKSGIAGLAAFVVACLAVPSPALAAESKPKTPIDLFLPEEAPGVHLSPGLVLKASADAAVEYDSNIYNIRSNVRSDTVGIFMPELTVATDWARHSLALIGSAEIRRYFDTTPENSNQWAIKGVGTFDLGSRASLFVEGGLADLIERRGTSGDTFFTDRPISYRQRRLKVELSRSGGIMGLSIGGTISKLTYSDATLQGVPIDLSYRDVVQREGHVRSDFDVGAKLSVYAIVSGNQVDYSRNIGVSRNSSGYSVLGGVRYQVNALVDVEGAAGYIHQTFDDHNAQSVGAANFHLAANWTPTPRWKLTASAGKSVDPSPLSNVPAVVRTSFDLRAQYAFSDKVLVEAHGAHVVDDYRGFTGSDKRTGVDASIKYRLSGHLVASVHAGYRDGQRAIEPGHYHGFNVGLTLGAAL